MRPRVLLAVLLVSAALSCARRDPTAADVVRGSGLRFLPRDTAGVAVIEAARIEDRQALERWLGEAARGLMGDAGLVPLHALMGGDLMKKVDRIAVALVPEAAGRASAAPAGWAALVEGRFDPATLSGGDGIVPLVEIASGPEISLTALPGGALSGGAMAIGPRAVLERIRAAAGRAEEGFATAPLMSILAAVSPAAHAWGAIDYAPLADFTAGALRGPGGSLSLPAPRSTGALRGVAFEGRVATDVGFTLVGVADAEPGAKQLADGARGLVALARMGASQGNDRSWLEFLDGLRIDQAGAEVRIRGTVSRPMLQAFAARVAPPGAARESDPSSAAADALPGAPGSTAAPAPPR